MDSLAALGTMITIVTVIGCAPQPTRVWRLATVEGLSLTGMTMTACTSIIWLTYGVIRHDNTQIAVNGICLASTITVIAAIGRFRQHLDLYRALAMCSLFGIVVFLATRTLGPGAVTATAVALSVMFRVPQAITSWRQPGGRGVSLISFASNSFINALWLLYGTMAHDSAIITTSCWGILINAFIAARAAQGRQATTAPSTDEAVQIAVT